MILRVDREHSTRPDHHVINVRAPVPNPDRVQCAPAVACSCDLCRDRLFTIGSDPPRAFFGFRIQKSRKNVPYQPLRLTFRDGSLASSGTRAHVSQIVPARPGGNCLRARTAST